MKKLILSVVTATALVLPSFGVMAQVPEYNPDSKGTYTVTHEVGAENAGEYYGVVAIKGEGVLDLSDLSNVVYIDQVTADEAGNVTISKFGLKEVAENEEEYDKCTVFIGGKGLNTATQIATLNVGIPYAEVSGKVLVAGVEITATDSNGSEYTTTSGADGIYKISVPMGTYSIKCEKNGYCSFTYTDVSVEGNIAISDIDMRKLAGDVIVNGHVNSNDLTALLIDYDKTTNELKNSNSDINGNGHVNANDLTALLVGYDAKDTTKVYSAN